MIETREVLQPTRAGAIAATIAATSETPAATSEEGNPGATSATRATRVTREAEHTNPAPMNGTRGRATIWALNDTQNPRAMNETAVMIAAMTATTVIRVPLLTNRVTTAVILVATIAANLVAIIENHVQLLMNPAIEAKYVAGTIAAPLLVVVKAAQGDISSLNLAYSNSS
jgi:hypothetical protein